MKKLLFVALTAVGLTACVQNEELAVNKPTAAISFADSYVSNTSRAESPVITTANLAGFDVWAFMDEVGGTVLTDEDVVKSTSGAWGYSNIQYWFPQHTYYFAALAPMNSANVTETLATGAEAKLGLGEIAFTNVDGTEDLLYAKKSVETPGIVELTNNGMDAVKMQFQHLLSKVRFTFNNGFLTPGIKVVVTDVKMTAPKSGTINLAQATYNDQWVLGSEALTLEFGNVAELDATQSGVAANERFSIPATDAYQYNVTFHVVVWNGTVKAYELDKEAVIEGHALEMGKAYNFTAILDHASLNLHKIEFTAEVDEWVDANNPETEIPVDYYVDTVGNYVVATEQGLQAIVEDINAGELPADSKIVLDTDIDLNNMRSLVSNWTPLGSEEKPYTGIFDGNGHTIKNLTLVEEEAKEGKAHIGFISFAKDATIKNVTFENVYINIPCLDIDHAQGHIGAVVGSLEGTSVVENVTVKGDIKIEATPTANGASRVAAVVGGNAYANVTLKNVHVIANAGSYVKANNNTGAIAGQLQGKTVFENCSSNIDVTVNKFFAGGIVGLAGTHDKFINCHTTGNIAVVAGREGRHNDEYRVGGIAGGWADGKTNVCELVNCSYTGTVSGVNADGAVADPLDYMGYVGRGYTLANCAGSKVIINGTEFVQKYNDKYGIYEVSGEGLITTAADFIAAINNVTDGGYVILGASFDFTEEARTNNGGWWDGLGYSGDKSFTIDLNGYTVGNANGALNDYLFWFQNNGEKASTITIKNGTLDAGTTAFCALCTASSNKQTLTVNVENVNLINNISNGSTVKVRGGSVLNVKAGTKITGKNSYLGIENWAATVNIYDGAEIYMNGTASYNGCLVGVGGNGTINVYGGYGKGVSGGLIAMTSGGTINVSGGEWIANTDGTYANSNKSVLIAQSDKQYNAGAGNAVVNVTGGTFKGGFNCYGNAVGDAQINISGGNYNTNPTHYLVDGYATTEDNGIWTVIEATKVSTPEALATAVANGGYVVLTEDITLTETLEIEGAATINLNGKTITATETDAIVAKAGAVLTISGNGKVVSHSAPIRAIGGKVTVEGGEFTQTGDYYSTPSTLRYSVDSREGGEIIIKGGTFKTINGMINVNANSSVVIEGGKFENTVKSAITRHFAYVAGNLTIKGGEFKNVANSAAGGEFFCGAAATGKVIVEGGKFTSLWASGSKNNIWTSYYGGSIEVKGGLFNHNGGISAQVTANTDAATKDAYPYMAK